MPWQVRRSSGKLSLFIACRSLDTFTAVQLELRMTKPFFVALEDAPDVPFDDRIRLESEFSTGLEKMLGGV